jgi:ribonuclease HII
LIQVKTRKPSFAEEIALRAGGFNIIAGIDEVGRGALMGPVVAAAVVLPPVIKDKWKQKVRDSKQLTAAEREYLFGFIVETAVTYGLGECSNKVIDDVGIAKATRLAMVEAVRKCDPAPEFLLIDFVKLKESPLPQKGITHGDAIVFSIACASIIAKVTRDKIITEMDRRFPGYGFATHKGYGTEQHLKCLKEKGPCSLHRRSFSPITEMTGWQR